MAKKDATKYFREMLLQFIGEPDPLHAMLQWLTGRMMQLEADLYQNEEKAQQTYIAGLGVESRLSGAWRFTGRYRGIARVPLGPESTVADRFNHEFGVNISWDPNP